MKLHSSFWEVVWDQFEMKNTPLRHSERVEKACNVSHDMKAALRWSFNEAFRSGQCSTGHYSSLCAWHPTRSTPAAELAFVLTPWLLAVPLYLNTTVNE